MKKEYRRRSLKFKLFFILIIIAFVFDVVMTGVSYYIYTSNINNESLRMCSGVTQTVASGVTPGVINSSVSGSFGEEYTLTGEKLMDISNSFNEIESINIYAVTPAGLNVVFSVNSQDNAANQPGTLIPYSDFGTICEALENGENISPVSGEENVTTYSQIKDASGKTVGYAVCTLSVHQQMQNRKAFITRLFSIVGIVTILVVIVAYFYMCRILITPISKMEANIRKFALDNSRGEETLEKLARVKPRKVLEVSKLKDSFADLIGDVSIKQTELTEFDNDIIDKMMSVINQKELEVKED